jgi:hypothetical protein
MYILDFIFTEELAIFKTRPLKLKKIKVVENI